MVCGGVCAPLRSASWHRVEHLETILLNGHYYEECTFRDCVLQFDGQSLPSMVHCTLDQCSWEFVGAAQNTLAFLQGLYAGFGDYGKLLFESTINNIRTAGLPAGTDVGEEER
jgi:hypothetical protein